MESFRTPRRSSLCGHPFASYDVGAFNAPPPPQQVAGGEIPQQLPGYSYAESKKGKDNHEMRRYRFSIRSDLRLLS